MKKALVIVAALVVALIILFLFGNHSFQTAPYSLAASPMTACRIAGQEGDIRFFANDPNSIHGFAIVQRRVITDPRLRQEVVDVLKSRLVYGTENVRCFEPGIAIRLGEQGRAIDALICLACRHIYFFRNGQVAYRNLNAAGVARIEKLYGRLFPGHAVGESDEDTKRIEAFRTKERERLGQGLYVPASKPAAATATAR